MFLAATVQFHRGSNRAERKELELYAAAVTRTEFLVKEQKVEVFLRDIERDYNFYHYFYCQVLWLYTTECRHSIASHVNFKGKRFVPLLRFCHNVP